MSAVQPLLAGALGLCLLDVALTSKYAANRLTAGAGNAPAVLARIVDPHVALFAPLAATTTAATTTATTPATPPAATTPTVPPGVMA